MSIFWIVDSFWTFLANYPAKSDIIEIIETAGCWKPIFLMGYAQFASEKNYGLQTSQSFESMTVFWKFVEITRKLPVQISSVQSINPALIFSA